MIAATDDAPLAALPSKPKVHAMRKATRSLASDDARDRGEALVMPGIGPD